MHTQSHTHHDPTTHIAYDRGVAPREDVAALLDRLAHHVRAGIIVGEDESIPLPDELAGAVGGGPDGHDSILRIELRAPKPAAG
jgi:hypothetical protein